MGSHAGTGLDPRGLAWVGDFIDTPNSKFGLCDQLSNDESEEYRMVTGSCLCGGVAFEIEGTLSPMQYCHATRCRKATGSAFAAELAALASAFRWTRGKDLITTYEAPLLREPPPYRHSFCRVCGSSLPVALEGTDFVVLHAGVLDGEPETRPFRHIFVAQRALWHTITDDLPQFEEHDAIDRRLLEKRQR